MFSMLLNPVLYLCRVMDRVIINYKVKLGQLDEKPATSLFDTVAPGNRSAQEIIIDDAQLHADGIGDILTDPGTETRISGH